MLSSCPVYFLFVGAVDWAQHVYPALHWLVFTLYSNKQLWNNNIHQFLSSLHLGLHLYPFIEMEHLKPKLHHLTNIQFLLKLVLRCEAVGIRKGHTCRMVHTTAALLQTQPLYLQEKSFSSETCGFPKLLSPRASPDCSACTFCIQEDLD